MSYYNDYGEQPQIIDANEVGVDASGSYWNMGNIRSSHLHQCNISGSRLFRMWISDSTLDQCWLNNSHIGSCVASNVDFSGSDFSGATIGTSLFINCRFENCQFQGASFAGVSFIGCDFTGCDFTGANLSGTPIQLLGQIWRAIFKRVFRGAFEVIGLSSGKFSRLGLFAVLSRSTIITTDSRGRWLKLRDAEGSMRFNHYRFLDGLAPNFFGRYALIFHEYGRLKALTGDSQQAHRSVFVGASFRFAKLQGARFLNADLSQADLEGANLDDADLRDSVVTGASFLGASLKRTNLEGVDLTQAKTDGANT